MKNESVKVLTAAYHEWLASYPWAKVYEDLIKYFPEDDADIVREVLRRDVWRSCRHRDEDITPDDIERSFKNLLDSHALDIYERRAEMFKQAGLEAERIQSEQEKEQTAAKAIQARIDEEAAFQQSILDRQKEDARNRELAKTPEGMKELRRKSLYPQVRTSSQSVPMPQSVKHIAQNPSQ